MAIVISGSGIDMGDKPISNASQIDSTVINENGNNVATEVVVNEQISNATKAGIIITFASSTAPTGYLKCNGALVSRTTYSDLFSAIGTTFGAGDGSTTFALPDLRGYFARGWDDGRGVDTSRVFGSNQADGYLNHSHTASETSAGAHTHNYQGYSTGSSGTLSLDTSAETPRNAGLYTLPNITPMSSAGAHTHTITVNASTTGTTETRPKNIALLYCIKY